MLNPEGGLVVHTLYGSSADTLHTKTMKTGTGTPRMAGTYVENVESNFKWMGAVKILRGGCTQVAQVG